MIKSFKILKLFAIGIHSANEVPLPPDSDGEDSAPNQTSAPSDACRQGMSGLFKAEGYNVVHDGTCMYMYCIYVILCNIMYCTVIFCNYN